MAHYENIDSRLDPAWQVIVVRHEAILQRLIPTRWPIADPRVGFTRGSERVCFNCLANPLGLDVDYNISVLGRAQCYTFPALKYPVRPRL